MGTYAIFPYLTLQMTDIGLTYSDISIIYLLIPAVTFFSGPISGIWNICLRYHPKINCQYLTYRLYWWQNWVQNRNYCQLDSSDTLCDIIWLDSKIHRILSNTNYNFSCNSRCPRSVTISMATARLSLRENRCWGLWKWFNIDRRGFLAKSRCI